MSTNVKVALVSTYDDKGLAAFQRDLTRAAGAARAQANGFTRLGQSLKNAGDSMTKMGGTLTKMVTLPLVGVGFAAYKAVQAASDLAETQSKVGVLFGKSADQIEKFGEKAATTMGQSKQQAMDAAATFAIFGKSAGLGGDELVKFSTNFTGLASDLASFSNTSPEEAITAIGAALRGETEPIRRYGVLLDDASMRQEALSLGIIKTTKQALTPQQKVLAAQSLIFKQTTAAQGDFERTSEGLANKQRILQAQLKNVGAEIGTALLPVALQLANAFQEKILPVILRLADKFGKLRPEVVRMGMVIGVVAAAAGPLLMVLGKLTSGVGGLLMVIGKIAPAFAAAGGGVSGLGAVFTALGGPIGLIILAVGALIAAVVLAWRTSETFRNAVMTVWTQLRQAIGQAVNYIKGKLHENREGINDLKVAFKAVADFVGKYVIPIIGTLLVTAIKAVAFVIGLLIDGITLTVSVFRTVAGVIQTVYGWFIKVKDGISNAGKAVTDWFTDLPGKIKDAFMRGLNTIKTVGEDIARGLWEGLRDSASWLVSQVTQWVKSVIPDPIEKFLGISSPSKLMAKVGKNVSLGLADGMKKTKRIVTTASENLGEGLVAKFTQKLNGLKEVTKDTMDDFMDLVDVIKGRVSKALDAANERLQQARQKYDDLNSSVQDAVISAVSFSDAASLQEDAAIAVASALQAQQDAQKDLAKAQKGGEQEAIDQAVEKLAEADQALAEAKANQKDFLGFLQVGADQAQLFADQIDQLRLSGASLEVVQQIVQLGAKTGSKVIKELLEGGRAAIERANQLVQATQNAARRAGEAAAQQFFGEGVRAAEAFVAAIEQRIRELEPVLQRIADSIAARLKIAAPNIDIGGGGGGGGGGPVADARPMAYVDMNGKVIANLPSRPNVTNAFIPGLGLRPMADGGIVTGPTPALIGEAGPEAVIPLRRSGMAAGINIEPGAVSVVVNGGNPADVRRAVDDAFNQLVRELRAV